MVRMMERNSTTAGKKSSFAGWQLATYVLSAIVLIMGVWIWNLQNKTEHTSNTRSMNHDMMMMQDLGPADERYDLRFIDAMIPHHEGALIMARDALTKAKRPEIKEMSKAIIHSQQKEIDTMKQWRKNWYAQ